MLQTIQLAHLPPELILHVALFRDLQNAAFLREQLIAGNAKYEYAFIDASMIVSTTHLYAAAFRAINDYLQGRLKSRNVHSEIVFALSPNNNIAESFRKFGITDKTRDLVAIKVATSPQITADIVEIHLDVAVQGRGLPFDDDSLATVRDLGKIRKAYKLPAPPSKEKRPDSAKELLNGDSDGDAGGNREMKEVEIAVLGAMALRGAS
ncbi:MAG: hypothetical protein Q9160_005123 [Pyrenula sp. 1 TL-2023]